MKTKAENRLRSWCLAAGMLAVAAGVNSAWGALSLIPAVRTVPHEMDIYIKAGHNQGATCSEEGIYLSHQLGIELIDWSGKRIRRVSAPAHLGDIYYSDGKIYGAFCLRNLKPEERDMPGMVRVWNEKFEVIAEKRFPEQLDGIVVLNGTIYVGVDKYGRKDHPGCCVKRLDLNLNDLGNTDLDLGFEIAYGVQTMATDGKDLFFGCYGGTACVSPDLKQVKRVRAFFGQGFGLVPKSVSKREEPVFFSVKGLGGDYKQWQKDPTNNPPRLEMRFHDRSRAFTDITAPVAETITLDAPFGRFSVSEPEIPARDFVLTGYGAKPGKKCTDAFAAAIAAANAAGGGRVVVPKGEWLTGAIHLKSNVNLHLAEGSTVVFTDDPADYPVVHTTWEGVECLNYSPLVYAYGCTNVAITGKGTLAPKMELWRTWFSRPPAHMFATECLYHWGSTNAVMSARDVTKIKGSNVRPHLLQINRSANVLLDGFRIRESPFWTIHLYHSENCIVRNLDVYAHGHNNDGVDIDMTKNALVEKCRFDQGDDGIVLKAGRNQDAWRLHRPTENVVVRDCEFTAGHTLLGIGSELSGGVRNVWVTNCRMDYCFRLCYIKTNRRRGGVIENIWMDNVKSRIASDAFFAIGTDVIYQWAKFPDYELRYTKIRNVHLKDIRGECAGWMFSVKGDAREPVEGLHFENLSLDSVKRGYADIVNAKGIEMKNVTLGTKDPPARCLFFAGDSTLDDHGQSGAVGSGYEKMPHRSWGTALQKHMKKGCVVRNFAQSGASTSSFLAGGRWSMLMKELKPGDTVAIQFGHNDQKWYTDYYLKNRFCPPDGSFRDYVRRFVSEVKTRGAQAILVSPIVRGSFGKDGKLADGKDSKGICLQSYAVAMREIAAEMKVPYVDMNRLTRDLVEREGPEGSKRFYVISSGWKRAQDGEPAKDVTHPVAAGAEAFSQLFLQDIRAQKLRVCDYFVW